MSAEINTETAKQEQPKSKRLSSLIWILVLWGGVRACSEMDGISWKRAFDGIALMTGLWPASLFLTVSILPRMEIYQSILRWASLAVVLLSFIGGFIFFIKTNDQKMTDYFTLGIQSLIFLIALAKILKAWRGVSK